jgi:single-stranded-DNA-specific exonuclease
MTAWIEPREIIIPPEVLDAAGGQPVLASALVQRGIISASSARSFLDPAQYRPSDPDALPGLSKAAARILWAIQTEEPILVWGDFDVDGQTSTTILFETLRNLGARVVFHIPVRERESHGVNLPVLKQQLAAGARLLVTCDTGVTANEAAEYTRSAGVDMIVTDHHDLPKQLPDVLALVNPKLLPEGHPLRSLSGAGVAYKLAEGLNSLAGQPADTHLSLDLAALGLIADLAGQSGDVRYLTQVGLARLRDTARVGLRAIAELAELVLERASEEHVAFALAPRLNALGRLADANPAVELLTTTDLERARVLAVQIEALNARRKLLTDQVFQAVQAQIERDHAILERPALVFFNPDWPAGVIGIVASRLVELYYRPVILFAAPPGSPARGSARSIEGCNITAAIATQAELLSGFGGHPMAAGLSLDPANLTAFQRGLERAVLDQLGGPPPEPALAIDAYVPLAQANQSLANDLERLAPFGPGNPQLVLAAQNVRVKNAIPLGRNHEHLQMTVEEADGAAYKLLWWQGAGQEIPKGRFDLAYSLRSSNYHGRDEVQIEWVHARPVAAEEIVISARRELRPFDLRNEAMPLQRLREITSDRLVQIWSEVEIPGELPARNRHDLEPGKALIVWTIPPGADVLGSVLAHLQPPEVYFFAIDPKMDRADAFLTRLAGLCKYALRVQDGCVQLDDLAAAACQQSAVIRAGLDWLSAQGHLKVDPQDTAGAFIISRGDDQVQQDAPELRRRLETLLQETAAFRAYYRRASPQALLATGGIVPVG